MHDIMNSVLHLDKPHKADERVPVQREITASYLSTLTDIGVRDLIYDSPSFYVLFQLGKDWIFKSFKQVYHKIKIFSFVIIVLIKVKLCKRFVEKEPVTSQISPRTKVPIYGTLNGNRNYRNDTKLSDRQIWANSVDPDQTAPTGAV